MTTNMPADVLSIEYERLRRTIDLPNERALSTMSLDRYRIPKYRIVLCTFAAAIIARRRIDVSLIILRAKRPHVLQRLFV